MKNAEMQKIIDKLDGIVDVLNTVKTLDQESHDKLHQAKIDLAEQDNDLENIVG